MASSLSGEVQLSQIPTISSNTTLRRSRSTSEITAETDLESGPRVFCRICLEHDSSEGGDELISPCLCRGTQQFVHRECLDHWRSVKEGFAFTHCSTCKAEFGLEVKEVNFDILTRLKHKFFVVRDFFLQLLIAQTLIVVFGCYAYLVDHKGIIRNAVTSHFSFLSSENSISFYYSVGSLGFLLLLGSICVITQCLVLANLDHRIAGCQNCFLAMLMWNWIPATTVMIFIIYAFVFCGIGYGLFLATMAVQRSWHRHYQILMKRNLTKDVVYGYDVGENGMLQRINYSSKCHWIELNGSPRAIQRLINDKYLGYVALAPSLLL